MILRHIQRLASRGTGSLRFHQQQQHQFHQQRLFSSYDYPLRTEAPTVTQSRASEISTTTENSSQEVEKTRPNDNFDDNTHTISNSNRDQILQSQKTHIRSSLDPIHKINLTTDSEGTAKISNRPPTKLINDSSPNIQMSTLPNGLRVISYENYGVVTSLGLICDFGSRYEDDTNTGVNHLLEVLSFHSTPSYSSAADRMMEMGGTAFASSSREQFLYCVDVLRNNVEEAMDVLVQSALHANYTDEEVEYGKNIMGLQSEEMVTEISMGEGMQEVAYTNSQLGRPHFCPADKIPLLSSNSIRSFLSDSISPNNLVLSGCGISHEQLLQLAEKHLSDISSPDPTKSTIITKIPSIYTGGEFRLPPPPPDPQNPLSSHDGLTRAALAFEIPKGWSSPDLVPLCALQTLLGGGNSFSAGGPGKGMYSRLYREILNRFYWAESAEAFTSFHSDSGLFGISGSAVPNKSKDLVKVMCGHFHKLAAEKPQEEELMRAKNMLKNNVLTQLESRLVCMEDLGRQILTFGKRETVEDMCDKIDAVTQEDVRRIGEDIINGSNGVTLSVVGDMGDIPNRDDVMDLLKR